MNRIIVFGIIVTFLLSCSGNKEKRTEEGFRYILHTDSTGPQPKLGDYVTIAMSYRTDDSVLFDTRHGGLLRFRLDQIPFKGSFESDILLMNVGDSATFEVPADSLYRQLFIKNDSVIIPQEETALKKGTFVKYDIKLLNVQDYVEAEQEMMMKESKAEKEEVKLISDFIVKNKITVSPDSNGIYKIISNTGKTGLFADTGKVVTVYFRGRLLDGKVFNATSKDQPYSFVFGQKEVIDGWEYALYNARAADRYSLIIPSRHAYGSEGWLNVRTGTYAVPPYSPLIFDIVVESVSNAVSAKK